MKKLFFSLVLLAFTVQTANAQWWSNTRVKGNGDFTSETRNVSQYDQVALEGSMDVELVAGTEGELTVNAERNLMDHILTEVSGNRLKISIEKGINISPSRNKSIKITVPFESLDGVSLTGSGDIVTEDEIRAESFNVSLTGSGDIELELDSRDVKGSITGSGDVELRGKTTNFRCVVTGSGDFHASGLRAENVDARVSGSGDIDVFASKELRSRVTGSGDITYSGNPQKEDFRTSGSGKVSKK